jgi:hypothetical protein
MLGALALALVLAACGAQEEPSRWDEAQQTSTSNGQLAMDEAVPGSAFNPFFPGTAAENAGFDLTFTQEKDGFAEAALRRDGTQVALLSVSDTATNPEATEKYQDATSELAGYPLYEAEPVTAVLVEDRFQVQVFSETDDFSADDRAFWLQQFDLEGIAALQ